MVESKRWSFVFFLASHHTHSISTVFPSYSCQIHINTHHPNFQAQQTTNNTVSLFSHNALHFTILIKPSLQPLCSSRSTQRFSGRHLHSQGVSRRTSIHSRDDSLLRGPLRQAVFFVQGQVFAMESSGSSEECINREVFPGEGVSRPSDGGYGRRRWRR